MELWIWFFFLFSLYILFYFPFPSPFYSYARVGKIFTLMFVISTELGKQRDACHALKRNKINIAFYDNNTDCPGILVCE